LWCDRDAQLCITVIGQDATRSGRPRPPRSTPTWSSCASTRWTRPIPRRRSRPAEAGDRDLPSAARGRHVRRRREERLRISARAQALGAEFVDIEWDIEAEPFLAARGGRGVIVSRHDFQGRAGRLPDLLAAARAGGGSREGGGHGRAGVRSAALLERAADDGSS
jgi:hypothetical protein